MGNETFTREEIELINNQRFGPSIITAKTETRFEYAGESLFKLSDNPDDKFPIDIDTLGPVTLKTAAALAYALLTALRQRFASTNEAENAIDDTQHFLAVIANTTTKEAKS